MSALDNIRDAARRAADERNRRLIEGGDASPVAGDATIRIAPAAMPSPEALANQAGPRRMIDGRERTPWDYLPESVLQNELSRILAYESGELPLFLEGDPGPAFLEPGQYPEAAATPGQRLEEAAAPTSANPVMPPPEGVRDRAVAAVEVPQQRQTETVLPPAAEQAVAQYEAQYDSTVLRQLPALSQDRWVSWSDDERDRRVAHWKEHFKNNGREIEQEIEQKRAAILNSTRSADFLLYEKTLREGDVRGARELEDTLAAREDFRRLISLLEARLLARIERQQPSQTPPAQAENAAVVVNLTPSRATVLSIAPTAASAQARSDLPAESQRPPQAAARHQLQNFYGLAFDPDGDISSFVKRVVSDPQSGAYQLDFMQNGESRTVIDRAERGLEVRGGSMIPSVAQFVAARAAQMQWPAVTLAGGSESSLAQAYIELSAAGIEVVGYEPAEEVQERLRKRLAEAGGAEEEQYQPSRPAVA